MEWPLIYKTPLRMFCLYRKVMAIAVALDRIKPLGTFLAGLSLKEKVSAFKKWKNSSQSAAASQEMRFSGWARWAALFARSQLTTSIAAIANWPRLELPRLPFISLSHFLFSGGRGDAVDPVPRVEGRARSLRGHHQHESGQ